MTESTPSSRQLLHLRQAAERGHMSQSHLRRLLLDGKGPPAIKRPGSNRWLFWSNEVDAWVESGRVKHSV
jgi:predicted DNA-binding transcriptional regulator AlpA